MNVIATTDDLLYEMYRFLRELEGNYFTMTDPNFRLWIRFNKERLDNILSEADRQRWSQ